MGNLSQDEAKILLSILNALHFLPEEARFILPIIDKLKDLDKQPTLNNPTAIITPENINIKIIQKAK